MININEIFNLLRDFSNKDQSSGSVTEPVFNRYAPLAQRELINSFLNNPRAYRASTAQVPRKGYESSQAIIDIFSDLKVSKYLNTNDSGEIYEPEDYMYFSSARINQTIKRFDGSVETIQSPVRVLRDNEIGDALTSEIERPTLIYPAITFYKGAWKVFPKSVQQLYVTYLREPKVPVWGYSTSSNGVPIYDSNTSQDFELPLSMRADLLYKMCQYTGVRMRERYLQEVSTYLKNQDEI